MAAKQILEAQNPLILRCNRLIEAFGKSDDERDFYLDRQEGFIIYVDLEKGEDELRSLEKELEKSPDRYCLIPKLTFYETKKIMEGFINEKVYDIDTKEKLLDIIQSKEARDNFLEFIYDHHSEFEKWQAYYQERSRIRIIEWLRTNHFHFVFEEDLDLPRMIIEKLKKELFQTKVGKDTINARKALVAKSKTYYSNEALNPRPKRGRPPKQAQKAEVEPQITTDIYNTVPNTIRPFLFIPELAGPGATNFASNFGYEGDLFTRRTATADHDLSMDSLNQKLAALRNLSSKWKEAEEAKQPTASKYAVMDEELEFEDKLEEEETAQTINGFGKSKKARPVKKSQKATKTAPVPKAKKQKISISQKKTPAQKLSKPIKIAAKKKPLRPLTKTKPKAQPKKPKPKIVSKPKPKAKPASAKKTLRPLKKLKKRK